MLQYTVTIANNNLVPLETIVLIDQPSGRLQYVPSSTTNYTALSTNKVPDNASGRPVSADQPRLHQLLIQAQSSVSLHLYFHGDQQCGIITNLATHPGRRVGGFVDRPRYPSRWPAGTVPVINFTDTNGVITNLYRVG